MKRLKSASPGYALGVHTICCIRLPTFYMSRDFSNIASTWFFHRQFWKLYFQFILSNFDQKSSSKFDSWIWNRMVINIAFLEILMNLASVESLQGHRFLTARHRLPPSCPDAISEFKHCDFTEWHKKCHKIKQAQGSMSVWFKDSTSKTINILVIEPVTMSVCRCI